MRPTRSTLTALATTLALALTGCGGGGGETTPASTSAQSPTTARPRQAERRQGSAAAKPSPQHNGPSERPPPQPGSKPAAPGVPTSKEGDNSIQTYGLEASNAERAQATALVQAYLNARASGNWAKVCSYLAAKPRAEQERFAGGAPCAKAMASFAAHAQTSILEEEAQIDVLSFRVGGKYAFLIYRRPDGIWATALTREAGNWKVVSVTPAPVE